MTDEEKLDRKTLAQHIRNIHNSKYDDITKAFFFGKACSFAERRFSTNTRTFHQWINIKTKFWKEIFLDRFIVG